MVAATAMKTQVLLLAVLLAHAAVGWGLTPSLSSLLENSACDYNDLENIVDCSAVEDVSEVTDAMNILSEAGFNDFGSFLLSDNPRVTSLPEDLFGDVQFRRIAITNNANLVIEKDFLGAARDVVLQIDLSSPQMASIPPLRSSSVTKYTQNAEALEHISKDALAGMPNLEVTRWGTLKMPSLVFGSVF